MGLFALQSPAGGFLDEDLKHFNKKFDDWCVQFDSFQDAEIITQTLPEKITVDIIEITPLSYPPYFFPSLQGIIHTTRQIDDKIICVIEPYMGSSFRMAICDLKTKKVQVSKTRYKSVLSVEAAFANFEN